MNPIGAEARYYYIRGEPIEPKKQRKGKPIIKHGGNPIITVCLLIKEGQVTRGVSVCSEKDNPCKKTGKAKALNRARSAMGSGDSKDHMSELVLVSKKTVIILYNYNLFHLQAAAPFLTDFEKRLLKQFPAAK